MAFDRRIREELRAEVQRTRPDLDRQLAIVQARSRGVGSRVGPIRRAASAMAATLQLLTVATIAAVIALVIVLRVLGPLPSGGGVGEPSPSLPSAPSSASTPPSPPDFPAIAGTYSATLPSTDPAVARDHLAGVWTLTLDRDGTMTLVAPQAFPDSVNGISGVSFSLDGDRFRTDLFFSDYCQSVGAYRWVRAGTRLTLTPDGDTCAIRAQLLTTQPWDAIP
jgi:hypothetical protein